MSGSPTQRSLAHLRAEGWTAQVVEKYNPHARVYNDLFGFIDIIAVRGQLTFAVQTTTAANVAARVKKIRASEHFPRVREAGWIVVVHGWDKRKGRWVLARDVNVKDDDA